MPEMQNNNLGTGEARGDDPKEFKATTFQRVCVAAAEGLGFLTLFDGKIVARFREENPVFPKKPEDSNSSSD